MGGGLTGLLNWFRSFFIAVIDWVIGTIEAAGLWIRGWSESAWNEIVGLLISLIPDGVATHFTDLGDAWAIPAYEIIAYVFPLQGIFTIVMSVWLTVATICGTRWLLAAIPRWITGAD